MNNASLHHAIIRSFLDRQRPPSHAELSERFGCSPDAVRAGLRALADDHGVVLHPHRDAVWVAHPFSAAPTACLVRAEGKTWWASCIWCALGLAHLAGGTATIEARHGGLGAPVGLRLEGGALLDPDHCVHFPIPMQRAWDNVHFTCAAEDPKDQPGGCPRSLKSTKFAIQYLDPAGRRAAAECGGAPTREWVLPLHLRGGQSWGACWAEKLWAPSPRPGGGAGNPPPAQKAAPGLAPPP